VVFLFEFQASESAIHQPWKILYMLRCGLGDGVNS